MVFLENDVDTAIIKNLQKLLVGSSMIEVSYSETFNLCFRQYFYRGAIVQVPLMLTIDTKCWLGDRQEWQSKIDLLKEQDPTEEVEDCLLAFELTRLRYRNLIQVEKVDLDNDFLAIHFPEDNILHIRNYADSDYAWILEEKTLKTEQERLSICCQDRMLYQNNIPTDFQCWTQWRSV